MKNAWLLGCLFLLSGCGGRIRNTGQSGQDGALLDTGSPPSDAAVDGSEPADGALDAQLDAADPCQDHCNNSVQDCGEQGVDCGGDCPSCERGLVIRGRWLGIADPSGVWNVCITSGELRYSANLYGYMTTDAKNCFNNNAAGTAYAAEAYVNGDLSAGFNQQFWNNLESHFQQAQAANIGMIVTVFGTVVLECERQSSNCNYPSQPCRWDDNPWNAATGRGGPYSIDAVTICGKDAFYTFNSYGTFVYQPQDPYPDSADMYTRGQWRQEEYIHKLATLARNYSNVAISLMWEGYDRGSHVCGDCGTTRAKVDAWHDHMAQYIRSISPNTLVASDCDISNTTLDFVAAHGAWNTIDWTNAPHPVISTGYSPEGSNGACPTDPGDPDFASCFAEVRASIRDHWAAGLQIGSPFWEYTHAPHTLPELSHYFLALRQFTVTVQTWQDEPGQELTAQTLPAP